MPKDHLTVNCLPLGQVGTPLSSTLGSRSLTEFRRRGLQVVVDTTHFAELDFADNFLSEDDQQRIARDLKHVIRSDADRIEGYLRFREVIQGWEVAFTHYQDGSDYVVLIVGYGKKGELESIIRLLARSGLEQLAPGARVLLEGRRMK